MSKSKVFVIYYEKINDFQLKSKFVVPKFVFAFVEIWIGTWHWNCQSLIPAPKQKFKYWGTLYNYMVSHVPSAGSHFDFDVTVLSD